MNIYDVITLTFYFNSIKLSTMQHILQHVPKTSHAHSALINMCTLHHRSLYKLLCVHYAYLEAGTQMFALNCFKQLYMSLNFVRINELFLRVCSILNFFFFLCATNYNLSFLNTHLCLHGYVIHAHSHTHKVLHKHRICNRYR